ncbi:uncharacterized protein PHACADRAFT_33478 [Phanerochaete carnosa HHB-10118-sp]|uniref:Uncharacterized protein n=1 Tax=Phanerochaete carnosa (strain HHB-10118-sp) TaxID=650164 RepID=K5UIS8_PHACS|nr:uncharacterized protein PHACADRAFT_33478 [Phanerochaete carnosa HHB-10118-sp]EKM49426.1 hypothetical protein PHACADRAFT_33478 [Phanerochaete carnosa HHB-10118-sp]
MVIGCIHWPSCLVEDAGDHYNYTNPALQDALYKAIPAIFDILIGQRSHPIISDYRAIKDDGIEDLKNVAKWQDSLKLPIFHADSILLPPLLEELMVRLRNLPYDIYKIHKLHVDTLVHGPGLLLSKVVVLRTCLHRKACDDNEI